MEELILALPEIQTSTSNSWRSTWERVLASKEQRWTSSKSSSALDGLAKHHLELAKHTPQDDEESLWMSKQLYKIASAYCDYKPYNPQHPAQACYYHDLSLERIPNGDKDKIVPIQVAFISKMLKDIQNDKSCTLEYYMAVVLELGRVVQLNMQDFHTTGTHLRGRIFEERDETQILRQLDGFEQIIGTLRTARRQPTIKQPANSQAYSRSRQLLAQCLICMFELTGKEVHLREALTSLYEFIPNGVQADNTEECLMIASIQILLAEYFRDLQCLDRAISTLEELANLVSVSIPPDLTARTQMIWADALNEKYESSRQIHNLLKAIEIAEKAARLMPNLEDVNIKISLVHDLLRYYMSKYQRTKAMEDATAALKWANLAIETKSATSLQLSQHRNQLANLFLIMFFETEDAEYLERALAERRKSLELDPASLGVKENLVHELTIRYQIHIANQDFERAARELEEALMLINELLDSGRLGTARRAYVLWSAGKLHKMKYEASQVDRDKPDQAHVDLDAAVAYFTSVIQNRYVHPLVRIGSARSTASLLASRFEWVRAHNLLHQALDSVPLTMPIHMSYEDQRLIIEQVHGLAAEACSTAIKCGMIECAIEDLERGRGFIIASGHKTSPEMDRLEVLQPSLYKRYRDVEMQFRMESDGSFTTGRSPGQYQMHSDMQELLEEIRDEAGFSDFLKPMKSTNIQKLCGTKTIVALNASVYGAHAILIRHNRVWSIPLPTPSFFPEVPEKLDEVVRVFEDVIYNQNNNVKDPQEMMSGLLTMLWHHVAEPVVTELGFTPVLGLERSEHMRAVFSRRVIWFPTGFYSRLPIHAADHLGTPDWSVMARGVVSTYISSCRMLQQSQMICSTTFKFPINGLILSMGKSQEPTDITGLHTANEEVQEVKKFGPQISWKILQTPTKRQTIRNIGDCAWLHVASHGISDTADPSASYLLLAHDKNEKDTTQNQDQARLTVKEISKLRVNKGLLAFLSSCSTAESRVPKLLDESLTIGSSFQAAGFAHVVGHLWPAYEFVSPSFVAGFYKFLAIFRSMDASMAWSDLIAFSVYFATAHTIHEHDCLEEPLFWAGFIHIGA